LLNEDGPVLRQLGVLHAHVRRPELREGPQAVEALEPVDEGGVRLLFPVVPVGEKTL